MSVNAVIGRGLELVKRSEKGVESSLACQQSSSYHRVIVFLEILNGLLLPNIVTLVPILDKLNEAIS